MNAEIVTIKLKIKNKEIELSAAEAQDLLTQLEKLFTTKTQHVPYPVYPTYPNWPQIVVQPVTTYPKPYEIWCGSLGSTCSSAISQITSLPFYGGQ